MRTNPMATLVLGLASVLLAGIAPVAAASDPSPSAIAVAQKACPADIADGWKCITLTLPVDHFRETGRTTKVTFALKRHTGAGPAKGVWVTITGGPGSAGIYSAVEYADTFAPSVRRDYDLVFMDQRGSGQSGGFSCPFAALELYTSNGLKRAARDFVEDCVDESGVDPDMLPFYGTRQAVEDLEAFRLWLGVDKMAIYGESYGTQYVQSYAAAHPHNVGVLFLDGAVDLKTSHRDYFVEGATAHEETLEATLLACTTEPACSRDIKGGNALAAYDQLAAKLERQPIAYTFAFADGQTEQRLFTATHLENAAAGALNNRTRRRMLQRAVAQASHGNVWWLARMAYDSVAQHPDTLQPISDPSWSDALYYAVECMDYTLSPKTGSPDQRADRYLEFGRERGVFDLRFPGYYTGELPCAYWPEQPGPNPRPTPLSNAPYPLVVMGSTTDPATPFANSQRIVERRGNNPNGTWLIYQPGGPHVLYGRYESCPDDYVTNILVRNKYPRKHTLTCPGGVAAEYVRNPDAAQIVENGRRDLLAAYENELNYGVDYWYWDYSEPLRFGCAFGGTIRYAATDVGSRMVMDECSFVRGTRASGEGTINDLTGAFRLNVHFAGQWQGHGVYVRRPDGTVTLTGNISHAGGH